MKLERFRQLRDEGLTIAEAKNKLLLEETGKTADQIQEELSKEMDEKITELESFLNETRR